MFSCFNRKISNIHPEGVICVICHEHVQEYYSCLNCSTKDNEPMENREGKICDPCLCKLRETHNNKCPLCRCEKINHRYGGDEYWHGNIIGKPEEELVSIDVNTEPPEENTREASATPERMNTAQKIEMCILSMKIAKNVFIWFFLFLASGMGFLAMFNFCAPMRSETPLVWDFIIDALVGFVLWMLGAFCCCLGPCSCCQEDCRDFSIKDLLCIFVR